MGSLQPMGFWLRRISLWLCQAVRLITMGWRVRRSSLRLCEAVWWTFEKVWLLQMGQRVWRLPPRFCPLQEIWLLPMGRRLRWPSLWFCQEVDFVSRPIENMSWCNSNINLLEPKSFFHSYNTKVPTRQKYLKNSQQICNACFLRK